MIHKLQQALDDRLDQLERSLRKAEKADDKQRRIIQKQEREIRERRLRERILTLLLLLSNIFWPVYIMLAKLF